MTNTLALFKNIVQAVGNNRLVRGLLLFMDGNRNDFLVHKDGPDGRRMRWRDEGADD